MAPLVPVFHSPSGLTHGMAICQAQSALGGLESDLWILPRHPFAVRMLQNHARHYFSLNSSKHFHFPAIRSLQHT